MTPTTDQVRAAGGLVCRDDGRIAIVHRPRYDDWSLPKGKLEEGESWEQAALREVHEETGVRAELGEELASDSYTDSKGRPKTVRWWRMRAVGEDGFAPDDEVDELRWATADEAARLLTYAHDRELVRLGCGPS
jgi:8-oxo-dGTP diphosphatase